MKGIFPLLLILCPLMVAADEPVGRVLLSLGENLAYSAQGVERPVERADPFFNQETLVTESSGRLQLRFSDGGMVALDPNSQFRVNDYAFGGDGGDRAVYELMRGGMRTLSGKIGPEEGGDYSLKTVVATIGIRGTHYALRLCQQSCAMQAGMREGLAGVVLDGAILVSGLVHEREVPAGMYFFVEKSSGDIDISRIPPAELGQVLPGLPEMPRLPGDPIFNPDNRPALDLRDSGAGTRGQNVTPPPPPPPPPPP
ncbi:MAG: FecR domain-containing protein, partial [Pseudomonas sp.]|nr:FecR domain-containing protein [Pseudomonas sp.]